MAPDKNNERRKNISPVQLEIMVSFMEKNLDFARGKLKREENERLWETLSKKLNAIPDGATKEINKWKLVCGIFSCATKVGTKILFVFSRGTIVGGV